MLSSILIVAVLLAAGSQGASLEDIDPRFKYGNANFMVDLILFNVNRHLPKTIEIPPQQSGRMWIQDAIFHMEKGVRRDGDATLITTDHVMKFIGDFKMTELWFECEFGYFLADGNIEAKTAKVSIASGITLKMDHGECPTLSEFRVTDMTDINVNVKGIAPGMNGAIERKIEQHTEDIEDALTNLVETEIKDQVQEAMKVRCIP